MSIAFLAFRPARQRPAYQSAEKAVPGFFDGLVGFDRREDKPALPGGLMTPQVGGPVTKYHFSAGC